MTAFLKIAAIAAVSLATIPLQALILLISKGRISYFIPQLWHKATTRILNLDVEYKGRPIRDSQVFFVGNHLSHFDIFILGSYIRASFVAKDDLARDPVVSLFCRLQQTALISRSSGRAAQVSNNIRTMIDDGKSIILFPEGTSTRGETVLDFRSSLFSLPLDYAVKGMKLQPFTIILREVDGQSAQTKELRDLYAWDRDNPIELAPHIWNFAHLKGARLEVIFHEPVEIDPAENRKMLAQRIKAIVEAPLVKAS